MKQRRKRARIVDSNEIREAFLRFFEGQGHKRIPSSSLVPKSDPTLLLTTAGMVQFKPYFTGEAAPPHPRLASCQKCFRTTDIDSVGDTQHLTFFEMLGNFSVGDYFKKEAVEWAWEFVTGWLKLSPERLWVTIYTDDDEAFDCWRAIDFPAEKIKRCGEKHNFWGPAGDTGPCGPCSEIHYDLGVDVGCGKPDCGPNCECGRFTEIWNLVFTQYDQHEDGSRTPLPKPNIDTGMGLERTAAAMQGAKTVYETDCFVPIIANVSRLTGKSYGEDEATDKAIRVVAEHARAVTFLIADGVIPSNEGRGYVLRRVLRRAALFGRKLGVEGFLDGLSKDVISQMKHVYPELQREQEFILSTIASEEGRFEQTLNVGLNLLDGIIAEAKRGRQDMLCGEDVFKLYDTYGFPRELTAEIAAERGFNIDCDSFDKEMACQQERARAARKVTADEKDIKIAERERLPEVCFVGDNGKRLTRRSDILLLTSGGKKQQKLAEGDEGEVVLRQTPFYGEMGGQVGDTGEIRGPEGRFIVEDTSRPTLELTIHHGRMVAGYISSENIVVAEVDGERRRDIARNHTATHLLQAALRQVLGEHVRQSGSVVSPDRLRFDFTHHRAVTREEISRIQRKVNDMVRKNLRVKPTVMTYREALDMGALAFFDEKYGDEVRVLQVGRPPVSTELCGGTHVSETGDIGYFHIVSEGSIGSGLRRIEAITGRGAEAFVEKQLAIIQEVAQELKTEPSQIMSRISALQGEVSEARKKAASLQRETSKKDVESLLAQAVEVNGVRVLSARVNASSIDSLRQSGDLIKDRLGSVLVVLGAVFNGQANFVAMMTPDLVDKGLHAGNIVKQVSQAAGGRGGGRAETGQGAGKDSSKMDKALGLVKELVTKDVGSGS
jgi:alanyl-tRNA synthetase